MMDKTIKPTETELEILKVVWAKSIASVREVHEELSKTKDAGYTNTLKLMQLMHKKNILQRDNSSKVHIYKASESKDQTLQQFFPKFVDVFFGGSSSQMVMQTLGNHTPSTDEINEIQELLNKLKAQQ